MISRGQKHDNNQDAEVCVSHTIGMNRVVRLILQETTEIAKCLILPYDNVREGCIEKARQNRKGREVISLQAIRNCIELSSSVLFERLKRACFGHPKAGQRWDRGGGSVRSVPAIFC